jgi:hypothetical protein
MPTLLLILPGYLEQKIMNQEKLAKSFLSPAFYSVLVVISLILSSCSQGKVAQCQNIIAVTKKMEEISQKSRQTQKLDEVLKVADAFEASSESLKQLKLPDGKLAAYQAKLAEIYSGNAKATRQFVSAFEKRDIPGVTLAKQEVQILGEQERQLVAEINQYCQHQ